MEPTFFLLVSFESLKPTHFRQLPMFLPFPVRLQSLPFTFWFISTVLWREGPTKGIVQGGTRLIWVTGDQLMLISKFRIWSPKKHWKTFIDAYFLCNRMSRKFGPERPEIKNLEFPGIHARKNHDRQRDSVLERACIDRYYALSESISSV